MKKRLLLPAIVAAFVMASCNAAPPVKEEHAVVRQTDAMAYKLYPTSNMWTFLKLDTRNGKIWQVQYSVKGDDYRGELVLNAKPLIYSGSGMEPGRFELYPTQNMYNFILLDGDDGNIWQVQWSLDAEKRGIVPIN